MSWGQHRLHVALMVCVLVSVACPAVQAGPKKNKKKAATQASDEVTVKFVYKRLKALEKKHENALDQLTNAVDRINYLSIQVDTMTEGLKKFSDDPPCPVGPGFFHAEALNSCYNLLPSTTMLSWTGGQEACAPLYAKSHMVSIESEEEHNYVVSRLRNERGIASYARFWTSGLIDAELTWRWSHSHEVMTYDNWIPTTLHNRAEFGCLALPSAENFLWGDIACWVPSMILCEIDL